MAKSTNFKDIGMSFAPRKEDEDNSKDRKIEKVLPHGALKLNRRELLRSIEIMCSCCTSSQDPLFIANPLFV